MTPAEVQRAAQTYLRPQNRTVGIYHARRRSRPMSLAPPAHSRTRLPGPDDITRAELPNGIVVLARANFNSPSVFIGGYLPAGSLFDPDEKLGLADFTARGADARHGAGAAFQQIYDALESAGASLGFDGGTHTAGFGGRALAEDLPLLLELLAEALRQPVFPDEPVERLRAQLLTGLAIRAQDTGEMASLAFDQIGLRRATPTAAPMTATRRRSRPSPRPTWRTSIAAHYGPRGLVLAIVGAVEPPRAVEQVAEALGDWRNPEQPDAASLPPLRPWPGCCTARWRSPANHRPI